jgi:hypothetical protein
MLRRARVAALAPHCALSEWAGVPRSCINPSLFLLRLQLPPSSLPVVAPALLAILGFASADSLRRYLIYAMWFGSVVAAVILEDDMISCL